MSRRYLFTSESVTEGHPDKICDQISDTILDALLAQDPCSRVAAEVVVNTGLVLITGEISSTATVNYVDLVRQKIAEIGYTDSSNGFTAGSCAVMVALDAQSPDIAQGVDQAQEQRSRSSEEVLDSIGAGDQGLMFGYACNETPELMPLPISLAHRISRQLSIVRKNGTLPYLGPDGKTQVTVAYEDGKPVLGSTPFSSLPNTLRRSTTSPTPKPFRQKFVKICLQPSSRRCLPISPFSPMLRHDSWSTLPGNS